MEYKVSIDKIKLKGKIGKKNVLTKEDVPFIYEELVTFSRLPKRFELVSDPIVSFSRFSYRYGFQIRVKGEKEGTLWLGLAWNGGCESLCKGDTFAVEFNPNKSGVKVWEWLQYVYAFKVTEITNFDLAFDIPNVDVRSVVFNTKADIMSYGSSLNKTYYVAPKGENRIKVYQKDLERAQKGVELEKTLRIEISLKGATFDTSTLNNRDIEKVCAICSRLREVSWITNQQITDPYVYLLSQADKEIRETALSLMSPNTRRKYKESLSNVSNCLDFEPIEFINVVTQKIGKYRRFEKYEKSCIHTYEFE